MLGLVRLHGLPAMRRLCPSLRSDLYMAASRRSSMYENHAVGTSGTANRPCPCDIMRSIFCL